MDWTAEAIERLQQYENNRRALVQLVGEIRRTADSQGKEDLLFELQCAKHEISAVDRGLRILNQEERRLLERFYITGGRRAATDLAEELSTNIKTIYCRRDRALRRFTVALYGCTEI